jgi:hypothetical protein
VGEAVDIVLLSVKLDANAVQKYGKVGHEQSIV